MEPWQPFSPEPMLPLPLDMGGKPEVPPLSPAAAVPAASGAPYDLDAVLDRLRMVESSGNPLAVNPTSGAAGAYQFMPGTVDMLGGFDPFDEEASRGKAKDYLTQLLDQSGGDMRQALAKYGGFKSKDPTGYVNKILGITGGAGPKTDAAEAPASPGDAEIADVRKRLTDALDRADQSAAAARASIIHGAERRGPIQQSITDELQQMEGLTPEIQAPPPFVPPTRKDLGDGFQWLTVLGALGGLMTSQPLTTALNNLTGIVTAINEGNDANFQRAYKEYEAAYKQGVQNNKLKMDKYQAIMDNHKLSLSQKMNELRLVALETQDQVALAQLDSNQVGLFTRLMASNLTAQARLAEANARIEKAAADHAKQMQHKATTLDAVQEDQFLKDNLLQVTNYLSTGKEPNFGWNPAGRDTFRKIANRLARDFNITPEDWQKGIAESKMSQGVLNLMAKWKSGVERASGTLQDDMNLMLDYARKLDLGSIKSINRLVLAGKKEFNDPDANAYAAAAFAVEMHYGRVMSGPLSQAQMHVAYAEHAADLMDKAQDVDSLKEVLFGTIKKDADYEIERSDQQINAWKNRVAGAIAGKGIGGSSSKPIPTEEDRAWARAHPEDPRFKERFGVEP